MNIAWVILGFIGGNLLWWKMSTNTPPQQIASVDNCVLSNHTIPCVHYVKAYDGDTFTVSIDAFPADYKQWQVRVKGIDTAEIKGKTKCEKALAEMAKETTEQLLSHAASITLKNVSKDKYFRLLADVDIDGTDLASELLQNSLAVAYGGGTKEVFKCPATLPKLIKIK